MNRNLGAVVVTAIAACALAGCSAGDGTKPGPATTAASISVGEDAALIAKHIKGCEDVRAGDIAQGAPALASTATCTIDGHSVNINSWSSADQANLDTVFQQDHRGGYYARGNAWTVTLGDGPILQYQLTNQADKLMQESFSGHTAWPSDPSAEQDIAKVAVASLGGEVRHVMS